MNKTITATINGESLSFTVTTDHYERYLDDMTSAQSKTAVSRNFLVRTINKEQKTTLIETLNALPGAALQLAALVAEDYSPDIEITVGE